MWPWCSCSSPGWRSSRSATCSRSVLGTHRYRGSALVAERGRPRSQPSAVPRGSERRPRTSGSLVLFASCTVLYPGGRCVHRAVPQRHRRGRRAARVAQAWYVVGSRDPHLAAIGFVWNPLPSAAEIPLVMLRGFWPTLTEKTFAGCIVSALCMAGAAVQLRALFLEIGASRWLTIAATACFALNPMVVVYGANGMSEAMYLLFLIGTARYLLTWTVTGRLAPAGTHRHQPGAGVPHSLRSAGGRRRGDRRRARRRRHRTRRGAPAARTIRSRERRRAHRGRALRHSIHRVGGRELGHHRSALPAVTSRYGNASIIRSAGGVVSANGTGWPKIVLALAQTISYAPLVVPLAFVAIVVACVAARPPLPCTGRPRGTARVQLGRVHGGIDLRVHALLHPGVAARTHHRGARAVPAPWHAARGSRVAASGRARRRSRSC